MESLNCIDVWRLDAGAPGLKLTDWNKKQFFGRQCLKVVSGAQSCKREMLKTASRYLEK